MARITVEDCVDKLPNLFELVMVCAQRVHEIGLGAELTIEKDNDKNPVIALREIASDTLDIDTLREGLHKRCRRSRQQRREAVSTSHYKDAVAQAEDVVTTFDETDEEKLYQQLKHELGADMFRERAEPSPTQSAASDDDED